jgi:UDP-N-acetylmuramoylalanine--D-glutamate ligase
VLLQDLAGVQGVVALCGLGVEVDAFVRNAPARFGSPRWSRVVVVEDRVLEGARLEAVADAFGCDAVQADALPDEVAAIVRSPGFLVPDAVRASVPTTNPAALWLAERRLAGERTVGVTGTKGKSSTTTLLAEQLVARGRDVFLGGNVGTALWERAPDDPVLTVAELSSYQAIEVDHSPDVAAITVLDEDHLDLHGTLDQYHQAKLNVVCGTARPADVAVVPAVDERLVRARCGSVPLRLVPSLADVRQANARVAAELLVELGEAPLVDDDLVARLVHEYPDLPGRFHEISHPNDHVRWIDDALASNAAALVAAVHRAEVEHAGRSLVLIVGGRDDRGVATRPVLAALQRVRPRAVLCLDEFGHRLAIDLGDVPGLDGTHVLELDSLEDAARVAAEQAAAAGSTTVVFSPGAPTPRDQGSWKDRSARFAQVVLGEGVR